LYRIDWKQELWPTLKLAERKQRRNETKKRQEISIDEQQSEKYQSTLISQKERKKKVESGERRMRAGVLFLLPNPANTGNPANLGLPVPIFLPFRLAIYYAIPPFSWHSTGNCQRKSVVRWLAAQLPSENAPTNNCKRHVGITHTPRWHASTHMGNIACGTGIAFFFLFLSFFFHWCRC